MAGGLAGSLVAGVPDGLSIGCGGEPTESVTAEGSFATDGEVELDFSCGELEVSTQPGTAWSVVARHGSDEEPEISSDAESLRVSAEGGGFIGITDSRQAWDVVLPTDATLVLAVDSNAASARLDLADADLSTLAIDANAGEVNLALPGAEVRELSIDANAGSVSIDTDDATLLEGSVEMNAGSLELCASDDVGVAITIEDENVTFSHNLDDAGPHPAGRHLVERRWRGRPPPRRQRQRGEPHPQSRGGLRVNRTLTRSRNSMVGGVAAGVAEWINADPALVRIAWALLVPITGGAALLAYIVAWVVIPEAPASAPAEGEPAGGGHCGGSGPGTEADRPGARRSCCSAAGSSWSGSGSCSASTCPTSTGASSGRSPSSPPALRFSSARCAAASSRSLPRRHALPEERDQRRAPHAAAKRPGHGGRGDQHPCHELDAGGAQELAALALWRVGELEAVVPRRQRACRIDVPVRHRQRRAEREDQDAATTTRPR